MLRRYMFLNYLKEKYNLETNKYIKVYLLAKIEKLKNELKEEGLL